VRGHARSTRTNLLAVHIPHSNCASLLSKRADRAAEAGEAVDEAASIRDTNGLLNVAALAASTVTNAQAAVAPAAVCKSHGVTRDQAWAEAGEKASATVVEATEELALEDIACLLQLSGRTSRLGSSTDDGLSRLSGVGSRLAVDGLRSTVHGLWSTVSGSTVLLGRVCRCRLGSITGLAVRSGCGSAVLLRRVLLRRVACHFRLVDAISRGKTSV